MRLLFSGFLLGIILLLLVPYGVFAIGNPEGGVSIGDVYVFRNLVDEGDQLYFCRYDVSYDPIPDEDPEDTWQMALYDSSDTLIGSRRLNYYQHNIISMYLTPSQALTWGAENKVRIMGMPSVFGTLTEGVNMRTRTLSGGDYYEKDYLAGIMIAQAEILETDWGITLLDVNDKLNDTGSTFFLLAVPGLGDMAPEFFSVITGGVDITYKNYTQAYRESLKTNTGSKLSGAIFDIGKIIGVYNSEWTGFWLVLILFLMLAGTIFAGLGNPGWAFCGAFGVIALSGYIMGGNIFTFAITAVLVVAALFGLYFILSRFA